MQLGPTTVRMQQPGIVFHQQQLSSVQVARIPFCLHLQSHVGHSAYQHRIVVQSHRREALVALGLLPSLAIAGAAAAAAVPAERDPTFYVTWQYATPADILPYIQQQAAPGDAQAVLDAMDTFSLYYP